LNLRLVLDAALLVIDRAGVEGLTVRAVARELGRPPMTLYTYFRSKQALLDLVFDRLLDRLLKVPGRATWQEEVEAACRHMRRELLDHPRWVPLLVRVRVPQPMLQVYEHLLGLMRSDGLGPEQAMFAVSSLMMQALGAVLVETMLGGAPSIPEQRLQLVSGMVSHAPRAFPRVAKAATKFDRWRFDRVFDVGLHSLIAGLARGRAHARSVRG
jgi:AcrR family transcriptional regulator